MALAAYAALGSFRTINGSCRELGFGLFFGPIGVGFLCTVTVKLLTCCGITPKWWP